LNGNTIGFCEQIKNLGCQLPRGGGIFHVSSDGDDQMGAKIKTQKNPWGFQRNPKNPWNKINPTKSHAEFPSLKKFQKGLNDITRKKTTRN